MAVNSKGTIHGCDCSKQGRHGGWGVLLGGDVDEDGVRGREEGVGCAGGGVWLGWLWLGPGGLGFRRRLGGRWGPVVGAGGVGRGLARGGGGLLGCPCSWWIAADVCRLMLALLGGLLLMCGGLCMSVVLCELLPAWVLQGT